MLKRKALVRLRLKGGKKVEFGPQTSIRLRILIKRNPVILQALTEYSVILAIYKVKENSWMW
jgi:hypothetical protein